MQVSNSSSGALETTGPRAGSAQTGHCWQTASWALQSFPSECLDHLLFSLWELRRGCSTMPSRTLGAQGFLLNSYSIKNESLSLKQKTKKIPQKPQTFAQHHVKAGRNDALCYSNAGLPYQNSAKCNLSTSSCCWEY